MDSPQTPAIPKPSGTAVLVRTRQHAASLSVGRSSSPRLSWGLTGSWVTGGDVEDRDVKSGFGASASIYRSGCSTMR